MINLFLKFSFSLTLISFFIQFVSQSNPGKKSRFFFKYSIFLTQILLVLINFLLLSVLIHNWITFKHIPISNLYESLIFLNWLISVINYFINYKNQKAKPFNISSLLKFFIFRGGEALDPFSFRERTSLRLSTEMPEGALKPSLEGFISGKNKNSFSLLPGKNDIGFANTNYEFSNDLLKKKISVSGILMGCSLCLYLILFLLPENIKTSNFLVPSLQSNWLFMHVTSIILSYAFLICGTLIALFFLLQQKQNIVSSNHLMTLDNLSYRLISIGFPLLTIGIISGAVWANEAWGSYWSWDPKETWALITWILFAIYLHTRLFFNWQGQKSAIIAFISLIILLICFFGVNFMSKGLHSYGFIK